VNYILGIGYLARDNVNEVIKVIRSLFIYALQIKHYIQFAGLMMDYNLLIGATLLFWKYNGKMLKRDYG